MGKEVSNKHSDAGLSKEGATTFSESDYPVGKHPNSLKNLKPFPKGVSGNPLGKPHKYQKLADALNKLGDQDVINYMDEPTGNTFREDVLERIWIKANQGDIRFIQMLAYLGCLDG